MNEKDTFRSESIYEANAVANVKIFRIPEQKARIVEKEAHH